MMRIVIKNVIIFKVKRIYEKNQTNIQFILSTSVRKTSKPDFFLNFVSLQEQTKGKLKETR